MIKVHRCHYAQAFSATGAGDAGKSISEKSFTYETLLSIFIPMNPTTAHCGKVSLTLVNVLSLPYHKWESDLSIAPLPASGPKKTKQNKTNNKKTTLQIIHQDTVLHRFNLTGQKHIDLNAL